MEKKNNSLIYIVIIIILSVCITGVGSYTIYDKFIRDDNKTKENTVKGEKLTDSELAEIKEIIDQGYMSYIDEEGIYFNSLEELTDREKLHLAASRAGIKLTNNSFKGTDLKKMLNVDFELSTIYNDHKYDDENYISFFYDKNTDTFRDNKNTLGSDVSVCTLNHIISATKENNLYTIKLYRLFNWCSLGYNTDYYPSIHDKTKVYEADLDALINNTFKEEDAFKNTENYKVYTMTFVEDDYGYLIQSYKMGN